MPSCAWIDEYIGAVIGKPSVGLGEPLGNEPVIIAPQDVIAAITVEVAGSNDLPRSARIDEHVSAVVGKTAVGLAEPLRDRAIIMTPENVVTTVTVEIACSGNVPRCTWV